MIPIKICGITRLEDARAAADAGAWATGFIFYAGSPRCVSAADAGAIVGALPASLVKVGVVVNASLPELERISRESGIRTFQLHGDETPDFAREVARKFSVIKAFRPKRAADLDAITAFQGIDRFLIDAFVDGRYGGTGKQTSPHWLPPLKRYGKIGLAGGINARNACTLARASQADFLDVSSGVEERPGIKSADMIRGLFAAVAGKGGSA